MTNVLHKNILGVLFTVGIAIFAIAMPAYGAEEMTATKEAPVMVAEKAMVPPVATITTEDLATLKSALDGLHDLLVSIDGLVAKLPKESRVAIAAEMNTTLSAMSSNLVKLNGTLAVATVVPGRNLAKSALRPVVLKEIGDLAGLSKESSADSVSGVVATKDDQNEKSLSLLAASLINSPQGALMLIVFAMIFGLIIFLRRSRREEAQPV